MPVPSRLARPYCWLLLLLWALAGPLGSWAQAPTFAQAASLNPTGLGGTSFVNALAVDAAGNQYLTGNFTGTLVLGATTLAATGLDDIFIAKRSAATGTWLWAVRGGGSRYDYGYGLAVDAAGNALVTGSFQGTATLGTGPTAVTLTTISGSDVFVAKLDAATGAVSWAVRAGGSFNTFGEGRGVAVDAAGNALVVGRFEGSTTFGSGAAATTLTTSGQAAFVARFAAATGALAWVTPAGSSYTVADAVALDGAGHALVTGGFWGTARFGAAATAPSLTSAGQADVFVARLDAGTGTWDWVVRAGGSGIEYGYGLAVDAAGNALVTGSFQATAGFGSGAPATSLTSAGGYDLFAAKFGAGAGALAWAVRAGSPGYDDAGQAVAVDATGNALVTGYFGGTLTFAGAAPLTTAGPLDVCVARLAGSTGTADWALAGGGTNRDEGHGVAVDASGRTWVAGWFFGAATFGSQAVAGTNNTGFVAQLTPTLLATHASGLLAAATVHPTPATGAFTLTLPGVAGAASATAVLLNALGQVVDRRVLALPAGGITATYATVGLAPGLYTLRVQAGPAATVRRVVVQ